MKTGLCGYSPEIRFEKSEESLDGFGGCGIVEVLGGELLGIEKSITFFLVSFHNLDNRADIDRGSPAEPTILVSVIVEDKSSNHDPCEEILCFR